MAWFYLVIAGLMECGWAIGLKHTEGFTKPIPSVITAILMVLSMWFLITGAEKYSHRYRLCCVDGYRRCRRCRDWYVFFG